MRLTTRYQSCARSLLLSGAQPDLELQLRRKSLEERSGVHHGGTRVAFRGILLAPLIQGARLLLLEYMRTCRYWIGFRNLIHTHRGHDVAETFAADRIPNRVSRSRLWRIGEGSRSSFC